MNLLIIYFPFILIVFGLKEEVCIYFDPTSKENCLLNEVQIGRFHTEKGIKLYEKIQQVNGSIDFYICKEKFKHEVTKHRQKETVNGSEIENIRFSKIDDLLKYVQDKNPFYPSILFSNIYIYERQCDGSFIKYEVTWEYYIE